MSSLLFVNEIRVRDYKEILKSCHGAGDPIRTARAVARTLAHVHELPPEHFLGSSVLAVMSQCAAARAASCGDVVRVQIDQGTAPLVVDMRVDLLAADIAALETEPVLWSKGALELEIAPPCLRSLIAGDSQGPASWIRTVRFAGEQVSMDSPGDSQRLWETLSAEMTGEIREIVEDRRARMESCDLLGRYNIPVPLHVAPALESFASLIGLLFAEPIGTFYDNIFALVRSGVEGSWLEDCSVGEYNYFVQCHVREHVMSAVDS